MNTTYEGRDIEVDFAFDAGEWCAMELRVLGVPVELTDELLWRLNDLEAELE